MTFQRMGVGCYEMRVCYVTRSHPSESVVDNVKHTFCAIARAEV
jgi:hypothetical protein